MIRHGKADLLGKRSVFSVIEILLYDCGTFMQIYSRAIKFAV